MNCCQQCAGVEQTFNTKVVTRELRHYRRKGPARTTRLLLDALKGYDIMGATLLDIGGGVGAIQHDLLKAGVSRTVGVDASSAYLQAAREEAGRQGHAGRADYHHGDFVALAPDIPQADIVTLDRVICCYHDMEALVGQSSARARRLYGVVYPRDRWLNRVGIAVMRFFLWLQGSSFRVFVHPSEAVNALVEGNGLRQCFRRTSGMWQVVVYERVGGG
jgi:hypothetical protein